MIRAGSRDVRWSMAVRRMVVVVTDRPWMGLRAGATAHRSTMRVVKGDWSARVKFAGLILGSKGSVSEVRFLLANKVLFRIACVIHRSWIATPTKLTELFVGKRLRGREENTNKECRFHRRVAAQFAMDVGLQGRLA